MSAVWGEPGSAERDCCPRDAGASDRSCQLGVLFLPTPPALRCRGPVGWWGLLCAMGCGGSRGQNLSPWGCTGPGWEVEPVTWWQETLPGAQQLRGAAGTGPALLGHIQPPGLGCRPESHPASWATSRRCRLQQPCWAGSCPRPQGPGATLRPGLHGRGEGLEGQGSTSALVHASWGQCLREGAIRLRALGRWQPWSPAQTGVCPPSLGAAPCAAGGSTETGGLREGAGDRAWHCWATRGALLPRASSSHRAVRNHWGQPSG